MRPIGRPERVLVTVGRVIRQLLVPRAIDVYQPDAARHHRLAGRFAAYVIRRRTGRVSQAGTVGRPVGGEGCDLLGREVNALASGGLNDCDALVVPRRPTTPRDQGDARTGGGRHYEVTVIQHGLHQLVWLLAVPGQGIDRHAVGQR
ncbi:MAG: hypothetical protein BAJATHORv1_150002 [Candidatus Thorarchaeota archaeon]|nr:MAG: hypothetical protein BAJATHORv1_150002 [Candidatus Thorarchaeota archaeon]